MRIADQFQTGKTVVSFEIFPPKPESPLEGIFRTLDGLKELEPAYVSVTYGAGGGQAGRSLEIAARIQSEYKLETLAHFTCVGSTRNELDTVLDQFSAAGVRNILALRGDPPQGQTEFSQPADGYRYAAELVEHIRRKGGFHVAAAAYPEGHRESASFDQELIHLREKVQAGADFLITQLFFDNGIYYRFLNRIRQMGIECPVAVGVLPVLSASQVRRITALCGATIPEPLQRIMDRYGDRPGDMERAGVEYACEQIEELLGYQVEGIHLYTMNKAEQARQIIKNTGLR